MMNRMKRSYLLVPILVLLLALSMVTAWGRASNTQNEHAWEFISSLSDVDKIFSARIVEEQQSEEKAGDVFLPLVYGVNPRVYSKDVDYIGHIGGIVSAMEVEGDYAYIGEGASLTILNISNPRQPVVVGRSNIFPWESRSDIYPATIRDIALLGNYIFVIGEGDQIEYTDMRVIDITDLANPTVIGFYTNLHYPTGIALLGDYAYVSDGSQGLRVIDISNPSNPFEAGYYDTRCVAIDVDVVGDFAYLADAWCGLQVIDISDPTQPLLVGNYDTPGSARSVVVEGNYAYVADEYFLQVIDISDSTNPFFVGDYITLGYNIVVVEGVYAYILSGGGLRVIDISDPAYPFEVGYYYKPDHSYTNISVQLGYAYVVSSPTDSFRSSILVIEVSDPANPIEVGFYDGTIFVLDVAVEGDFAYVADREDGLKVIDVSEPANPFMVGNYIVPSTAIGVVVAGDYAFVVNGYLGQIIVIDISDPANPSQVSIHNTPGFTYDVTVAGNYAYVADGTRGLRIIDISDPTNLSEVGFYDNLSENVRFVAIQGSFAYISCIECYGRKNDDDECYSSVRVIDVSNPSLPEGVGYYQTPGSAMGLTVSGDYVYIANGGFMGDSYPGYTPNSLRIIDISSPTNPFEVSYQDMPDLTMDVTVVGDYAYVSDFFGGIRVIDISNPANPFEVGFYDTPGLSGSADVVGSFVIVADKYNGIVILNYLGIKDVSTTSIQSDDPDPSLVGEPITVTYQVNADFGIPSGAVTVTVEGEAVGCTGELVGGMGSCEITINVPGTYTLTATYSGDDYFLPSSGNEEHTVIQTETMSLSTTGDTANSSSSIALDGDGNSHISYNGYEKQKYAYHPSEFVYFYKFLPLVFDVDELGEEF